MPDEISAPTAAPDPFTMSTADLAAAFQNAQPVSITEPTPVPEPTPAAPVAPEPATEPPAAPATPPADAPAPPPAAPAPTFDPTAFLREKFGVETPEAVQSALDAAKQVEGLRANQRTAEDIAFQKLLTDPQAGNAFLKLQLTDYKTLPAKELLAAAYAHDHPELPAELAELEADLEFKAKYNAIEFEDADDPQVKAAKLRLDYATASARSQMEQAKSAARTAVLSSSPSPTEESAAEIQAKSDAWVRGVEAIIAAPPKELTYSVEGQEVKVALDTQSAAFKEAALDPVGWLEKQVRPTGKAEETNYGRLAEIVAVLTQHETLVKNAYAAGRASLGPVVPLNRPVNPAPAAPQAPTTAPSILDAFRTATPRSAAPQGLSY